MADSPASSNSPKPKLDPGPPPRLHEEGETAPAYAAFKLFVELGDEREVYKVAEKSTANRRSIYAWSTKFRWKQRLDEHALAVRQLWLDSTKRQFDKAADRVAEARIAFMMKTLDAATLLQTKGMEVVRVISPIESQQSVPSADGKTIHVTIKPSPNVRLSDGARLILAANLALSSAEQAIQRAREPHIPRRGSSDAGGQAMLGNGDQEQPILEIWVDGGDGTPLPLSSIPEPDDVDPNFNPLDGTTTPPQ